MSANEHPTGLARLFGSFSVAASCLVLALSTAAYAQNDDSTAESSGDEAIEEIITTGSRLKRSTYTSISPIQVITQTVSREIGLIDSATILQQSTAATGTQIDLTFQGFVLDNGPGSSTLDLRGLGAARTLVLVNGRRLAPSGVEGAPISPDLNLIPSSLVQRYDILLDGASSVYGSDAVAGVANIILRQDFDGLEIQAFGTTPTQAGRSGGEEQSMTLSWGKNGDRGFFGVGVDYRKSNPVRYSDRAWTDQCDRHVEEVEGSGDIRTNGVRFQETLLMPQDVCKTSLLMSRFAELSGRFGSVYYTPNGSNTGIPNFSEAVLFQVPFDSNGNGVNDINYRDYSLNGNPVTQAAYMYPKNQRTSIMAYGEYTFSGDFNLTPYFEMQYNTRKTYAYSGTNQFFPTVSGDNLYNPCNPGTPGAPSVRGVDCGDAYDAVLTDPTYVNNFGLFYEDLCASFGLPLALCTPSTFGLLRGSAGPVDVLPIVTVQGDRSEVWSDVAQTRVVAGLKGDLPFLNFGSFENWGFDLSAIYAESDGESLRRGINEERLNQSLDVVYADPLNPDPSTIVCRDPSGGCIPTDLFAADLYSNPGYGDLPQANKDFLFDDRTFRTKYRQTLLFGFLSGDLFDLPAGEVLGGLGFEVRDDKIESLPNDVARDGLLWNFFVDQGASGSKYTREFFGELELPLLAGMKGAEELTLNLSGRYTKDEFFDAVSTYSVKLGYRPVESLLLRGTSGTSYRAPNLRENFLAGQTGFLSLVDPCVIPDDARNPIDGGYDPTLDQRDSQVLANCLAAGVDPTVLDNGGVQVYGMEISAGGVLDVKEETSDSFSLGFVWDQPFFDSYDLSLSYSYYEIEIQNEIIEPNGQFIINDCYNDPNGNSAFCDRISRDAAPGAEFINLLDAGFINRDSLKTRGMDVNVAYAQTISMFDRAADITLDLSFNRQLENSRTFVNEDGTTDFIDLVGRFGFPRDNARAIFAAEIQKYRFTWSTRYMSAVAQDPLTVDPFDSVPDGFADTCLGPAAGDVNCRDVGFADSYYTHDVSLFFYGDQWTFGGGFRNLFNTAPPLVDTSEVFAVYNTPLGALYDLYGRTLFVNLAVTFE
jgi:iron complex outermembrane recepter protein